MNSCQHGNGTALFTRSGPAARKFQDEVQVRGPRSGAPARGRAQRRQAALVLAWLCSGNFPFCWVSLAAVLCTRALKGIYITPTMTPMTVDVFCHHRW